MGGSAGTVQPLRRTKARPCADAADPRHLPPRAAQSSKIIWPTAGGRTRSIRQMPRPATISAMPCNRSGARKRPCNGSTYALTLSPDNTKALNNKAFALSQVRRFDEAVATYDLTKAIDPGNAVADWNMALLHMLRGNFRGRLGGARSTLEGTNLPVVYPQFTDHVAGRRAGRWQNRPGPTKTRDWVTPSSSRVTCRCWQPAARMLFWWSTDHFFHCSRDLMAFYGVAQ